jgi:hypothetical protein
MMIRQISRKPQQGNKFSDNVVRVVDNMTRHYERIWKDFTENKEHAAPCVCWLCLWRKYEKDKPVGHPYDFLSFFARDIISGVEDPFQDEEFQKISTRRIAREVIRRLPIFSLETKAVLNEYSRLLFCEHFEFYSRRKRYQTQNFFKLVEKLQFLRYKEWKKTKPEPVATINFNKKYRTEGQIILGIMNFVNSEPGRKTTQRELCRHLNKPIAEIEPLQEFLKNLYGIEVGIEGRSVVYYATRKLPRRPRR